MPAKLQAVQPVLMVRDVTASIQFYERLGFRASFRDSPANPQYAGVARDGVELHLQWHEAQDFSSGDRPTCRFVVPEIDELSADFSLSCADLELTEVADTPWGTCEFHVRDPDRHGLHFYRDL